MKRPEGPVGRYERLLVQAGHRCGYCQSSQRLMGVRLILDHLMPRVRGGIEDEENLWPSYQPCNGFKQARVAARDPISGTMVPLFNPRRERWAEHFAWVDGGRRIVGLTATVRATEAALQLNRAELMEARSFWIDAGWHPPATNV